MHGIDKRATYACAVVIPPDGGICKCFDAYIRGVDWMVTLQTRLQAGSLQTFNAGVAPRKGGDKGSPISNKKYTPYFVTWRGGFSKSGVQQKWLACHPLFWTPKKAHPLKIGGERSPLKNRWYGPTGKLRSASMLRNCGSDVFHNFRKAVTYAVTTCLGPTLRKSSK